MADLATISKVKALVSESVFKRAQDIEASDKLREVEFTGEEALLTARGGCIGSSPTDIYVLKVSIDGDAAVGDCSCPAGKNAKFGLCKHVVAILLRRVKEAQRRRNAPWTSDADEEIVRIASQNDDVGTSQVVESNSSSLSRDRVASASSSKRTLPAWMSGVVGIAEQTGSPRKSKKRPPASNPPRPVPVVRKRRRTGHQLEISDIDDRTEDPGEVEDVGEVEDARPVKEGLGVGVVQNETFKPVVLPSAGALARERRRLKEQKKEDDFAIGSHDDEDRCTTGPAVKRTGTKPVANSKRRRLKKKFVAEDSDLSENEPSPNDVVTDHDFRLTDDDLMFLAQEQLQGQNAAQETDDEKRDAEEGSSKAEVVAGKHQPKEHTSPTIFSMGRWRDTSSYGPNEGPGKDLRENPDDLDMETLKNFTVEAGSQFLSQLAMASTDELLPEQSTGSKLGRLPIISPVDETDAIANDMLSIMFGAKSYGNMDLVDVARAYNPANSTTDDVRSFTTLANTARPSPVEEKLDDHPSSSAVVGGREVDDVGVQCRPKKKSSLKDKVKMFLG